MRLKLQTLALPQDLRGGHGMPGAADLQAREVRARMSVMEGAAAAAVGASDASGGAARHVGS